MRDSYLQADSYMSHIWKPTNLTHDNLSISTLVPHQPERSQPLTNFDFGGPNGKMLASLTRIVVRMLFRAIIGMEFFYKDQASLMIGTGGNAELSFVIDGPGGERVTDVEIMTNNLKDDVRGLKVWICTSPPCVFSMADLESPRYSPVMVVTSF